MATYEKNVFAAVLFLFSLFMLLLDSTDTLAPANFYILSDLIYRFTFNEAVIFPSQVSISLTWLCQRMVHANQALLLFACSRSQNNQEIDYEQAHCLCLRGINWIKVLEEPCC